MQIAAIRCVAIMLPLLAQRVCAGFPSPADDHVEQEIDLSKLLISNRPATFLVRVIGDSMTGKQLFDGDLAVVDRSLSPRSGDVVIVDIDDERSFKVWNVQNGKVSLSFGNAHYPAFVFDPAAIVEVWGVVSSSINLKRRPDLA